MSMRSFVWILRVMGRAFRRAARMGFREYLVSRGGRWRERYGRCAVCGAVHSIEAFRAFSVIDCGPIAPLIIRREHESMPCGHTVFEHLCHQSKAKLVAE
jgi:hypothetical protein